MSKRKEKCHGMNKEKRRGKKDKIKNKNLINKTKQTKNVMPLKKNHLLYYSYVHVLNLPYFFCSDKKT